MAYAQNTGMSSFLRDHRDYRNSIVESGCFIAQLKLTVVPEHNAQTIPVADAYSQDVVRVERLEFQMNMGMTAGDQAKGHGANLGKARSACSCPNGFAAGADQKCQRMQ